MIDPEWTKLRYQIHDAQMAINDNETKLSEARQRSWWALGGASIVGGLAAVTVGRYGLHMSGETAIAVAEGLACSYLGYLSLRKHITARDAANDITWHQGKLAGLQIDYDKRPGRLPQINESILQGPYPTIGGFRHDSGESVVQN